MANVKLIANTIFKYVIIAYKWLLVMAIIFEIIDMFKNTPINKYWLYHMLAASALGYIFIDLKQTLINTRKRILKYKIKEKYDVDVEFALKETIKEQEKQNETAIN